MTATAASLTTTTPNGPFTVIHDGGTVLASGWTDDPGYLMALVNPRLRPVDELVSDQSGHPGQAILDAITAYYDGEPGAVEEIAVEQGGGPFIEQSLEGAANRFPWRDSHLHRVRRDGRQRPGRPRRGTRAIRHQYRSPVRPVPSHPAHGRLAGRLRYGLEIGGGCSTTRQWANVWPVITGEQKRKVDAVWDAFWTGEFPIPLEVMEQITYLLFIRGLDDEQANALNKANLTGRPIEGNPFPVDRDELRWSVFKNLAPAEMFRVVDEEVFPFIKSMRDEESTFSHFMKDARLAIPNAAMLARVVDRPR